jgi:hypothetical protein
MITIFVQRSVPCTFVHSIQLRLLFQVFPTVMESGSPSASSSDRSSSQFATIFGTLIALLTLTLPLMVIAYYSSSQAGSQAPARYLSAELQ